MTDLQASHQDALEELHDRFLVLRYDDGLTDTADIGVGRLQLNAYSMMKTLQLSSRET